MTATDKTAAIRTCDSDRLFQGLRFSVAVAILHQQCFQRARPGSPALDQVTKRSSKYRDALQAASSALRLRWSTDVEHQLLHCRFFMAPLPLISKDCTIGLPVSHHGRELPGKKQAMSVGKTLPTGIETAVLGVLTEWPQRPWAQVGFARDRFGSPQATCRVFIAALVPDLHKKLGFSFLPAVPISP